MKILQLNVEKGWRGGERQTLYCMQAFRDQGATVELLARKGQPLAERAQQAGFVVHEMRHVPDQIRFLSTRARRFDLVHAQTANTVTWAVLTKWAHRRPIVFSRRTSFPVKPGDEWKTGFKWRRVDQLVAISEMAAVEPRRLGIEPIIIRSAVKPQPTDPVRNQALSDALGLAGKKVIATSAALIADKDPETLIRAIALLAQRRHDVAFVHFGAGGNREAASRALIDSLGLTGIYHLAGFQSQVESYYALMDVFVMASREEALGSSVFDAFLQQVPVVSTDAGGLRESLAQGRGLLCPVGDFAAMAAQIERALDDTEGVAAMTRLAYDYVRDEHDVQVMGRRYMACFARLAHRSDP